MKKSTALVAVLFAMLGGACGAGPAASPTGSTGATTAPSGVPAPSATPAPSPSASPSASPSPVASPTDRARVVVRIEQTGGMMPPWETLRWYPSVVLYADGRLIMQGPQIEIYPGPALPNLQVTHLTQTGVEQVLAWAVEAGLHGPDRELGPLILDSGATVFTIVSPDGTHRTSITDMSLGDPEIGAAREFQEIVMNPREWLGDEVLGNDEPYAFDRMRLISFVADPQNNPDPGLSTELQWPLDQSLATIGDSMSEPANYRCAELHGEELAQMLPLFQHASELTLWRSDEELYQLYLHPLLPDDEPCPGI